MGGWTLFELNLLILLSSYSKKFEDCPILCLFHTKHSNWLKCLYIKEKIAISDDF